MGFDLGAFVAGIYGMNLTSGLEQNPYAFYAIMRLFRYRKIKLCGSNKIDIF